MEYRSSASFLGLPLVHVATGALVEGRYRRGVATAWYAAGDIAVGVLFACGGIAIGGVSLGGAALGLLPIGGVAVGVLAIGGLAAGFAAFGGAAFAWYAAIGGLALARNVIVPPSPESLPVSSIPRPQLAWPDALLLLVIVAAMLMIALSVRARRKE